MDDPKHWSIGLVDRQGIRVGMPGKQQNRTVQRKLKNAQSKKGDPNYPSAIQVVEAVKTTHPPTTSAAPYQVTS